MREKPESRHERKVPSLALPPATWARVDALLRHEPEKSAVQIVQDAIEWYARFRGSPEAVALNRLTPRQRDVLTLIGEGHSNKGIAAKLGISVKTVETHRTHLMKVLNLHGVAGLVRFALRSGLITLEV